MTTITEILAGFSADQGFVIYLLVAAFKSLILLLIVLFVTKMFSSLSSAGKHFIWTVAFLILFMFPMLSIVLPSWDIPVSGNEPDIVSVETLSETPPEIGITGEFQSGPYINSAEENRSSIQHNITGENPSASVITGSESLFSILYNRLLTFGKSLTSINRFMSLLFNIWLAGIVLLVGKFIFAHWMIYRIYRNSIELNDVEWNTNFQSIKATFNISRPVTLLKNDKIQSPMTWGLMHPVIVIPSEMVAWTGERKRYILLHELAHVKRMDMATQYMAGIVCIIQWFNPLVWISNKRMLNECEHACDDYVIEKCKNPSDYAKLLLEVAGSTLKESYEPSVVISMANKKHLEKRLLSIFNKKTVRPEVSLAVASTTVIGIYLLAVPLIMFSPTDRLTDNELSAGENDISFAVLSDSPSDEEVSYERLPEDAQVRQFGAQDTSTVTALTDILYDDDKDIRMHAVEALGQIGTATAVNSVINYLRRYDWDDLDDVVSIFSSLNSAGPIHSLMNSLKDQNRDIRREAVFTLNNAPNANSIQPFCDYMEDEDSRIREEAAVGLGRIGDPEVLSCLIPYLQDVDHEVRIGVIEAIEAVGNTRDPMVVAALCEALEDESSEVREEAAETLGALRDPLALEPLSMALNDESSDVREEVAEALGKIGDPSAIESLTNALKNESRNDVRRVIMSSIGAIYSTMD